MVMSGARPDLSPPTDKMKSHFAQSVMALMTAVAFMLSWAAPCACSTAMADEGDDQGSSCCPSNNDSTPDDEAPEHDCCGSCVGFCSDDTAGQSDTTLAAVTADGERELPAAMPSPWTPDLLAAIWFVERLAAIDLGADRPTPLRGTTYVPDQSDNYLRHATLLI